MFLPPSPDTMTSLPATILALLVSLISGAISITSLIIGAANPSTQPFPTQLRDFILAGAGLVLAVSGVLAAGSRWIVGPLLHGLDDRIADQVEASAQPILDKLSDMESDVREIRHEVTYDSGTSLKDMARKNREQLIQVIATLGLDNPGNPVE